jgi:Redoxin.
MKRWLLLGACLLFLKLEAQQLRAIPLTTVEGKKYHLSCIQQPLTAIVFLAPDCPLSQNYTLVLNTLQSANAGAVAIVGVFTGTGYSRKEITDFREKYKTRFLLARDEKGKLAQFTQATVTPQVFLYDSTGNLLYKGAIDDWVVNLGRKKQKPEQQYLQNAINCYLNHTTIDPFETKAIGCYISQQ